MAATTLPTGVWTSTSDKTSLNNMRSGYCQLENLIKGNCSNQIRMLDKCEISRKDQPFCTSEGDYARMKLPENITSKPDLGGPCHINSSEHRHSLHRHHVFSGIKLSHMRGIFFKIFGHHIHFGTRHKDAQHMVHSHNNHATENSESSHPCKLDKEPEKTQQFDLRVSEQSSEPSLSLNSCDVQGDIHISCLESTPVCTGTMHESPSFITQKDQHTCTEGTQEISNEVGNECLHVYPCQNPEDASTIKTDCDVASVILKSAVVSPKDLSVDSFVTISQNILDLNPNSQSDQNVLQTTATPNSPEASDVSQKQTDFQTSIVKRDYIDLPDGIVGSKIAGGRANVLSTSGKSMTLEKSRPDICSSAASSSTQVCGSQESPCGLRSELLFKLIKRGCIVGRGATSVVRLCCNRVDVNKKYAIKEFRKRGRCETERDYIKRLIAEFCISSSLRNENIVSTIDLVQNKQHQWCAIMEYCAGGDLCTKINSGTLRVIAEVNCYFKQLVNGIHYLHSVGVAHRDVKPENLLLSKDGRILKIADFGTSAVFRDPFHLVVTKTKGLYGSGPYVAPEQFQDSEYDPSITDIWSMAIVYYVMTYSTSPWKSATPCDPRYKRYAENPVAFPPIKRLGPGPKALICRMLDPNPESRIKIDEVFNDKWIKLIEACSENLDAQKVSNHDHCMLNIYE